MKFSYLNTEIVASYTTIGEDVARYKYYQKAMVYYFYRGVKIYMLGYAIDFEKSMNGQVVARCVVFPDIIIEASDECTARQVLRSAIEIYLFSAFKKKRLIPLPVKVNKNRPAITFSVLVVSKIYLVNAMIEKRIQKTELARRLNCHMQQVDRLLDFSHASKIERVEEGLMVLGRGLELRPSDHMLGDWSIQMLRKSG